MYAFVESPHEAGVLWAGSDDGLLHISEISDRRVRDVRDELKEGQQILVKCIGKEGNKVKLSRKAVLAEEKSKGAPEDNVEEEG